jgi:hypothetical protein
MALALLKEGFYEARMTKESRFPTDLAACHAMLAERDSKLAKQAGVVAAHQRELKTKDRSLAMRDRSLVEKNRIIKRQKIEMARLEKEHDAALQFAFRKKLERSTTDPK